MTHGLPPRRDIDFILFDWLRLDLRADRDNIVAFLDLSESFAAEQFLPHYKRSDAVEPKLGADGNVRILPEFKDALREYANLGFFSAGFPESLGGLDLPSLACAASLSYFFAANIATAAYPMLTGANARLIRNFGSPAQIETFARPQVAGRWFGTMCLSEPQAGSSLADIGTRAVLDGKDALGARYRLAGNKMWISGGDQDASENIVHLVLAKIPGSDGRLPAGTAGISLFIVPRSLPNGTANDVAVAGLNHKMGYRGTANCLLNFGEGEGAVGWLVGSPGEGLRQMFQMMNEARISVGLGAAALACRSYGLASRYARERLQGRSGECREGPQVAIIEHPDIRRMLLAQKAYAEGGLALCLYCADLVDQDTDADQVALLGLLTPVAKTWSSEYGLLANDIAIQVHGGYGYTRDFDVEQLWRDNRLNPIHEGTTAVQALDLLGRKILRDGDGMNVLGRRLDNTAARAASHARLAPLAGTLRAAWECVGRSVEMLRGFDSERQAEHATEFLRAFGHVAVAWLWLEQALVAANLDRSDEDTAVFVDGKLWTCRYFFERELPKLEGWLSSLALPAGLASRCPSALL